MICPECEDEMSELMFGEFACDACGYVHIPGWEELDGDE